VLGTENDGETMERPEDDADGEEPDPRWSLANERTLLAYTRTALALIVGGLAVSGSHTFADAPAWLAAVGLPLIALGSLVAATSRRRFTQAQRAMRTGEPLPAPTVAIFLPWGVALVAVVALVAAFVQLL
jgi:putative membrane protein